MLQSSNPDEVRIALQGLSSESRRKIEEALRPIKTLTDYAAPVSSVDLTDLTYTISGLDLESRTKLEVAMRAMEQETKVQPVTESVEAIETVKDAVVSMAEA